MFSVTGYWLQGTGLRHMPKYIQSVTPNSQHETCNAKHARCNKKPYLSWKSYDMRKFNLKFLLTSLVLLPLMWFLFKFVYETTWIEALGVAIVNLIMIDVFIYLQTSTRFVVIANILFEEHALEAIQEYDPVLVKEKKDYKKYRLNRKKWPYNRVTFKRTHFNIYIEAPYKIASELEKLKYEKA